MPQYLFASSATSKAFSFDGTSLVSVMFLEYIERTFGVFCFNDKSTESSLNTLFNTLLNQIKANLKDQGEEFSFDTGGYTGAWGQAGKLAVLHEKELVLNKYDTENLLQAIPTHPFRHNSLPKN